MDKKSKRVVIAAVIFIFAAIGLIMLISKYPAYHIRSLANDGLSHFKEEAFEDYLEYLREESGVSDLSAAVIIAENEDRYQRYYDKETRTLTLSYRLHQFTSDAIDDDYTTEYKSDKAISIYKHLRDLAVNQVYQPQTSQSWSDYRYKNKRGETVVLKPYDYDSAPSIRLVSGQNNVYNYYVGGTYIEVDVNDELLYYWEAKKANSSSDSKTGTSGLGNGSAGSSGSSSSSGKSSSGRSSSGSSSSGKTVDGYDDPDDYATDYEDDYDDYDDAYDAWEDEDGD